MPGMDRQPKLRPQKPFEFFANGLSSQLPPPGTVARSAPVQTVDGPAYHFENVPLNTGTVTGTTNFVETNPLPVTETLLARGHQRFDIYCAPCHGRLGDGNGITKAIGDMPAVANLHDQRIIEMTDGEIFHTITMGKGLMGAYGPIVPAEDRWAIIAYLRVLQLSALGTTNDLTSAQQAVLNP
jgi:mono/diheme cytochrome c family protein